MMKKIALVALAAGLIAGPALAADQMSTSSAKPATTASDSSKSSLSHKLKKEAHHKKDKKEAPTATVK